MTVPASFTCVCQEDLKLLFGLISEIWEFPKIGDKIGDPNVVP